MGSNFFFFWEINYTTDPTKHNNPNDRINTWLSPAGLKFEPWTFVLPN
jgi:hypothetical protein